MAKEADFLGVKHDLAPLKEIGLVSFWPSEHILASMRTWVTLFRSTGICTPGQASKFRGIAGFTAMAEFGQLGKAPLNSFKQRQYFDVEPWTLSHTMERALDLVEMLIEVKPQRHVRITRVVAPSLVVASDAQVECSDWPGGGTLVHDPLTGVRVGRYLQFQAEMLSVWGLCFQDIVDGKQPIALCEAAMLPLTLLAMPELFRGRDVIWYVDNTSAMAAFVKGASKNEHLERIVIVFWFCAFHLDSRIWIEWVDSGANWSDGLSREFERDPFIAEHGFAVEPIAPDTKWWAGPLVQVWARIRDVVRGPALGVV
jgi:hypothetical protein